MEEVFKTSMGLHFQSLLIRTPYAINHKRSHFVPPSVNNSLSGKIWYFFYQNLPIVLLTVGTTSFPPEPTLYHIALEASSLARPCQTNTSGQAASEPL